ncbi:MAG: response regulator transcription factor [Clostridia bacterium]|nr:response regulator transcription factor [Clostridia bacterium]
MIKVTITDDYRISRDFFEMYIKTSQRYKIMKTFISAAEALEYCKAHSGNALPDIMVMDVMMREGIDGLSAAEQIKALHPEIKILIVTSTAEAAWIKKAKAAGIEGIWYKQFSKKSLLEVLDSIADGKTAYDDETPSIPFGNTTSAELTDRERDVLRELSAGLTNEEIAAALGMSINTVNFHIRNMLEKTGFANKIELMLRAKEAKITVSDVDRKGDC